jgi:hypothetical protein
VNLSLDATDLRPIVAAVVAETLQAIRENAAAIDGHRLAYSEAEAAAALGCRPHVLRDARLRGEFRATRVGGRIAYETAELHAYLARGRKAGR